MRGTAPDELLNGRSRRARQLEHDAHIDSMKVVRCLDALSRPVETPEAVLAAGLQAMAEAFDAPMVCLVRTGAPDAEKVPRDVMPFRHGFPPDCPASLPRLPGDLATPRGWSPRVASWSAGEDGGQLVLGGVRVHAGARFSPSSTDPTVGSVLVLRTEPDPFSPTELGLLSSVAERLLSAARAAEGRRRAEMLVHAVEHLSGHRTPVSQHLAGVLAGIAGARWVGVVESGAAFPIVTSGSEDDLPAEAARAWTLRDLERASAMAEVQLLHDAPAVHPLGGERDDEEQSPVVRSALRVPVLLDGRPQALLYALHPDPGAFSPVVVDAVVSLAGFVAAALRSSRLYTALTRSEAASRHGATHDPLTGLANRALLVQELEQRLGDIRGAGQVGVLFCDLDGFKPVNDRYGHEAGDQMLRQVATRMAAVLRPGDLLARLGGDEFVALVDGAPTEALLRTVGERLLHVVAQPLDLPTVSGRTVRVSPSASVGGALAPRGPDSSPRAEAVLRDADTAMYDAKRAGGHRVRIYDEAASRAAQRLHELDVDLTDAIAAGAVAVHYQPVWDLVDGRATGVEALARWEHPVHGRIAPDVFIPLAERSGAVVALGAAVLRRACQDLTAWGTAASHLGLAVNASPVELRSPSFAAGVLKTLADHSVLPSRLAVEVTEGLPLGGPEVVQVQALRSAGVRVVVDDFGVSHSDLARLKHLPVDGLKIDRSLVSGLSSSPDANPLDRGLVEAILVVARAGGMSVVAEGVETEEESRVLASLGCRTVQGWLTGRPVPACEVTAALRRTGVA